MRFVPEVMAPCEPKLGIQFLKAMPEAKRPLSHLSGPKRAHKHEDPTNHGFWYPSYAGRWTQNVRSFCLSMVFGAPTPGS